MWFLGELGVVRNAPKRVHEVIDCLPSNGGYFVL